MTLPTIRRVAVANFKVDRLDVRLGRLNLVLGPVGVGKSTIADAVQFAAHGCLPRVGKAPAFTSRLMRGSRADVSVEFDHDGAPQSVRRSLMRDGASLALDAAASWLHAGTAPTQAGEAVRMLFGATEAEAEQNLDVLRLLNAGSGDLATAVERLLDMAGMDAAEIRRVVETQFRGRIETLRPNTDGILGALPQVVADVVDAILPQLLDRSSRSLIDAKQWAADAKNAATTDLRTQQGARTVAQQRADELKPVAESEADLRTRKAAAVRRATELGERLRLYRDGAAARLRADEAVEKAERVLSVARESLEVRRQAAAELDDLRARLSAMAAPTAPTPPAAVAEDLEALRARLAPLEAELAAVADPVAPAAPASVDPDPSMLAEAAEIRGKARELRAALDGPEFVKPALPGVDDLVRREADARRAFDSARALPWREVEKIADDLSVSSCFVLVQNETDRLRALARQHGGDVAALLLADVEARSNLAAARLMRESVEREIAAINERRAKVEADAAALEKRAADREAEARDAARKANDAARAQWSDDAAAYAQRKADADALRRTVRGRIEDARRESRVAVDRANGEITERHGKAFADYRNALADHTRQHRETSDRIAKLEQDLAVAERLERESAGDVSRAKAARDGAAAVLALDDAATDAEIADANAEAARLEVAIRAVSTATAVREHLASVIAAADRAEALRDAYAAAEWAVGKAREIDIGRRAGALEEPMRRFLAPVASAGEPRVRVEKGKVQLGLMYADRFVDSAALSGGQAALFRAALGYAVLVARKPILRFLHIELAEACDGRLEDDVLRACEAAADEVQFVVTTCVPIAEPEADRGWNVVRLEKEVAHVEV